MLQGKHRPTCFTQKKKKSGFARLCHAVLSASLTTAAVPTYYNIRRKILFFFYFSLRGFSINKSQHSTNKTQNISP